MNVPDFALYRDECPCYQDETGQCYLQVTYNGHVNDPRYGSCCEHLCPAYFWMVKLAEYNEH